MFRIFLLILLSTFSYQALAEITVDSTRKSGYDYACVDVSGTLPMTNHQRFDKAQAVCVERAIADPAGTYQVQGGRWQVSVTNTNAPPPPVPPDPGPTDPPIFFLLNTECVPTFEGIGALDFFDMSLCIDGPGVYAVSVSSPWTVTGAVITAPASGQGELTIVMNFADEDVRIAMVRPWTIAP